MAKEVIVGRKAIINEGTLKGKVGTVIRYDYLKNEVQLLVDPNTLVTASSDHIIQNYIQKFKDTLREIQYWSKNEGKKLFKGNELNPTIKKIIGKNRIELLNKWIEGIQIEF